MEKTSLQSYILNHRPMVYMPYLTMGDPSCKQTINYAISMIDAGAEILEIGIPFSDPTADGPVIQAAMVRALNQNDITLDSIFEATEEIHQQRPEVPIIFLTYFNPIISIDPKHGEFAFQTLPGKVQKKTLDLIDRETALSLASFLDRAKDAGVRGIVIPDLPFDARESKAFELLGLYADISRIQMIAPNTAEDRLREICSRARGFIYYVTSTGVTGERKDLPEDIKSRLKKVRSMTEVPVLAGFGISNPSQVDSLRGNVDGIIVGSLNHRFIENDPENAAEKLSEVTMSFVQAIKKQ